MIREDVSKKNKPTRQVRCKVIHRENSFSKPFSVTHTINEKKCPFPNDNSVQQPIRYLMEYGTQRTSWDQTHLFLLVLTWWFEQEVMRSLFTFVDVTILNIPLENHLTWFQRRSPSFSDVVEVEDSSFLVLEVIVWKQGPEHCTENRCPTYVVSR